MTKNNQEAQAITSLDGLRIDAINITIDVPGLPRRTISIKPLSYHDWQMTALEVPDPKPPDKWVIKDGKKTKDGVDMQDSEYLAKRQAAHMERQYRRLLKAMLGVPGQFDELRELPVEEQLKTLQESAFMGYTLPVLAKLSELSLEGFANVDALADTFPAIP